MLKHCVGALVHECVLVQAELAKANAELAKLQVCVSVAVDFPPKWRLNAFVLAERLQWPL